MGNSNSKASKKAGYNDEPRDVKPSDVKPTTELDVKTYEKMTKVMAVARKAVCIVNVPLKKRGTGALYEVVDRSRISRFLIMTCNHVLPTNSLKEITQTKFEFGDIEEMKHLALSRDHIINIWTSTLLDATVIEISSELATMFKSYGAIFLKVGNVVPKDEVAVLQYLGGQFSIAYGNVDRIVENDVYYQIGTAGGSSGSPLLDWNCVALAMHKQGDTATVCDKVLRKASVITAVVETYLHHESTGAAAAAATAPQPHMQLVRRICTLDPDAYVTEMSFNAQADELFLQQHKVVRATRVRESTGEVRDVYRGADEYSSINSVCHMRGSDTLLVCSYESAPNLSLGHWVVALSRLKGGGEWCEKHRVKTEGAVNASCALSDSRVLIGGGTYLELFHVKSGPRIARERLIKVPYDSKDEFYNDFSATCGSDGETHVAMSIHKDGSVRVFRLVGDRLDEMARIQLGHPDKLLWVGARLLVSIISSARQYSYETPKPGDGGVVELELKGLRLERRAQLIAGRGGDSQVVITSWCAFDGGILLCNSNKDSKEVLHYSLT